MLVGFSDHTMSTLVPITAAAVGACLVEKHFTLSRALPDGDNDMSVEPDELKTIVDGIREVEGALGSGHRSLLPGEESLMGIFRRGVYARKGIAQGQKIEADMLAVRRPLSEIPANQFDLLIGKVARVAIAEEDALQWEHFDD